MQGALERIKSVERFKLAPEKTAMSDLEVSVFSDSIVISSEMNKVISPMWAAGFLQADLLYMGILTRGGMAAGPTIHGDGILYGEGMLEAYKLENEMALNPRIIVSEQVLKKIHPTIQEKWMAKDYDGMTFIDPFRFNAMAPDASELAADGYDPRWCYFDQVKCHLEKMIETATHIRHLDKFRWTSRRYNLAVSKFNEKSLQKCETITLED